jgi:hypothetical protein
MRKVLLGVLFASLFGAAFCATPAELSAAEGDLDYGL